MFNRYVARISEVTQLIPFRPQCLFLDEPTNFLDREALGGLAVAIKEWGGAVCIISHSTEFVTALCPEIWHVDKGELTHKGKVGLVEDAFEDPSRPVSRTTSKAGTPRNGTPTLGLMSGKTSAATSAANSGAEDAGNDLAKLGLRKKKKKVNTCMMFEWLGGTDRVVDDEERDEGAGGEETAAEAQLAHVRW